MIRKVKGGYNLYSIRAGKKMNRKPFRTRKAAVKRERQIQYFKRRG